MISTTSIEYIAKAKVYFTNSMLYMALFNFFMIAGSFKAIYSINISIFIIIPILLFIVLLIGYLDYRFINLKMQSYANDKNDMKAQLNRIEYALMGLGR